MLQVKNLTKVYSSNKIPVLALNDFSVDFGSSGLVVVLGKSGCGKSTLLNILGGLDTPTSGKVIVNGQDMSAFKGGDFDAYRNTYVGIVFQEFNLIDEITVYENIDMTLKLQEKSAEVLEVEEALHLVGLSNLGYRKPTELSGGQRQRVALARALLKKPEIILADEPTGSLDSVTAEEVFESLKKISETKLVIIVTHEKSLANKYADRIIEIVDGKMVGDRTKISNENLEKNFICGNVLEVSSGTPITLEDLKKGSIEEKVNYIGFTADKEKVALAYPETVDRFYTDAASSDFRETKKEDITDNKKPFKLSKGKLKISDAINMARQNIKRTKKRYRFLTRIAIVCFTFFALSFIIGSTNIKTVVSESAFNSTKTPVVNAVKQEKSEYGQLNKVKLTDEDFIEIRKRVGAAGKVVSLSASPLYMNDVSKKVIYGMSSVKGMIEEVNPTDIGLKIISGSEDVAGDEIIISDLFAFEILRSRFVGYSSDNVFGIIEPSSISDIIGSKIQFKETEKYYKIKGIFETESSKYNKLIDPYAYDPDLMKERMNFLALNDLLLSRIFVPKGFSEKFINETIKFDYDDPLMFNGEMYSSSIGYTYGFGGTLGNFSLDGIKPEDFLWTASGAPITKLKENECIVAKEALWALLDVHDFNGEITDDIIKKINATTLTVNFRDDNIKVHSAQCKIVGVAKDFKLAFSTETLNKLQASRLMPEEAIYNRGSNAFELKANMDKLEAAGYYTGTLSANENNIILFEEMLKSMSTVFFYIGLVMAIFIFIILFNYMNMSVKFRQKEVAVYRVVGAKSIDIGKIFFTEGAFMVIKITIWATLFSFLIISFINSMLNTIIYLMGATFQILTFNFLLHPLFILLVCAAFVLLATIIPIMNIVRKKPSEAVRLIAV